MNNEYFNYFVMFFFIVVIMAMISKILRLQFSMFNIKEGIDGTDTSTSKSTTTSQNTCIDTTQTVSVITDKIKKNVDSLTTKIKSDRTEIENLITSYHDLISVWAIQDLMVTDPSSNDCVSKLMMKLSMYGNAEKCLESSLHWLDEQH